eukprot:537604_1
MANRAAQRIADEITDIGYQVFPDISWVYNKPLHVSGPTKRSHYSTIESKVLNSPLVLNSIEQIYNESGIPLNKLNREAKLIFNSLSTQVNSTTTRSLAYIFRKFWRSAYDGVYVNMDGLKRIKEAEKHGPVILLPTHKSYADFILISYLFYEHNMPIPRIIAGMNLDFLGVGALLKKAGAIWIRRSFSSDKLYQAVFESYIHSLLSFGTLLECFIEGGRSRVGKVLSPKIGFLRTIVHILINDNNLWSKDIQLIPISISYDKLMESSAYATEMLGGEKKKETLKNFINAANSVMKLKLGSINIHIGECISLKNKLLQRSRANDVFELKSQIIADKNVVKHVCLKIAHEVLYNMNLLTSVTATSAIGTILLTEEKRGLSVKLLGQKITHLVKMVKLRNGKVANIFNTNDNNSDIVVDKALGVMTKLVVNRDGIVMISNDNSCLELAMYRNQCLHHFVHESLVAIAIFSLLHSNSINGTIDYFQETVTKGNIMQCTQFLSRLLKHEFMYKPSTSFMENFDETLDFMIDTVHFVIEEWIDNVNIIRINEQHEDVMFFLAMLIWPYIDIYWVISMSLKQL